MDFDAIALVVSGPTGLRPAMTRTVASAPSFLYVDYHETIRTVPTMGRLRIPHPTPATSTAARTSEADLYDDSLKASAA
jgi:hypothetical protein